MDFDNLENEITFLKPIKIGEALNKIDYKNKKDIDNEPMNHSKKTVDRFKFINAGGNIQDARISFVEWEKTNNILFELLGEFCGKDAEVVKNDSSRDLWLSAEEALAYGIIDEIVKTKKKGK